MRYMCASLACMHVTIADMQLKKAVKTVGDAGIPLVVSYLLAPSDGVHLGPHWRPCEFAACTASHIFSM